MTFLDLSNLKTFAGKIINVPQKLKFVLGRGEIIVRKEENAVYQHILLFPKCFQKDYFSVFESQDCVEKVSICSSVFIAHETVENIVGKGKNFFRYFLLFPQCFQNSISLNIQMVC